MATVLRRLCRPLASCSAQQASSGLSLLQSHRFSTDDGEAAADTSSIGNEKVQQLAADIMGLTILEASWLSEILRKKLNIQKPAMGAMPMSFAMPAAAPAAGGDAAEAPKEEKKEKTEFDVKLDSFSAEGKIKVIKEIRAITSLGLKEAKELVRRCTRDRRCCRCRLWRCSWACSPRQCSLPRFCAVACAWSTQQLQPAAAAGGGRRLPSRGRRWPQHNMLHLTAPAGGCVPPAAAV